MFKHRQTSCFCCQNTNQRGKTPYFRRYLLIFARTESGISAAAHFLFFYSIRTANRVPVLCSSSYGFCILFRFHTYLLSVSANPLSRCIVPLRSGACSCDFRKIGDSRHISYSSLRRAPCGFPLSHQYIHNIDIFRYIVCAGHRPVRYQPPKHTSLLFPNLAVTLFLHTASFRTPSYCSSYFCNFVLLFFHRYAYISDKYTFVPLSYFPNDFLLPDFLCQCFLFRFSENDIYKRYIIPKQLLDCGGFSFFLISCNRVRFYFYRSACV